VEIADATGAIEVELTLCRARPAGRRGALDGRARAPVRGGTRPGSRARDG